jgi:thiol-disulfide isomerase/thioredoxin
MKNIIIIIICLFAKSGIAQNNIKERIIYGKCNKDSLLQEPFSKWFLKNNQEYKPHTDVIEELKKQSNKEMEVVIYFGNWCGDSKREVPRFVKVLSEMNFSDAKITFIALGASDSLYKQSPAGDEKGQGIYRVPVFIIKKKGKEIGRINEFPINSLEKDLLQIISGQSYTPNYAAFEKIMKWQNDGTLIDENSNAVGLANQIKQYVNSEYQLNSLANLLKKQGAVKESLKVFKINYNLYPESQTSIIALAEAFLENNEKEKAVSFFELALQQEKDKEQWRKILESLYKAKGLKM